MLFTGWTRFIVISHKAVLQFLETEYQKRAISVNICILVGKHMGQRDRFPVPCWLQYAIDFSERSTRTTLTKPAEEFIFIAEGQATGEVAKGDPEQMALTFRADNNLHIKG